MPTDTSDFRIGNGTPTEASDNECAISRPEESAQDLQIVLLLFVVSCAYLSLFRRYTAIEPDEGIILQGAQRILQGQVLYRDFFSFFTPGSYYFLALLFRVFGTSFLVARSTLVVFGAVFSLLHYLLARRVCSGGTAFTIALLVTITTLPFRFVVLHNWDSTLLALLALYSAVRWVESAGAKAAFATGSFAALTFVFEQSKGGGLCLGLAAGILAIKLIGREKALVKPPQLYAVASGLVWPLLLTVAYFAAEHSLSSMLVDWLWPLKHYSTANHVPYGYQNWSDSARHDLFGKGSWIVRTVTALVLSPCFLIPVLPIIGLAMLLYWTWQMRRHPTFAAKSAYYVLICSAMAGLLLSIVIVRADIIHFIYLAPVFLLVLAWAADGRDIPGQLFRAIRPFLNAFVLISFVLFAMALLVRTVSASHIVETRRGTIATPEKDSVIDYVQTHVAPGEKIFVYPYLPLYYFLTATTNLSRFEYFQPGMNTTEQGQELLAELQAQPPRVILWESSFAEKIPNSWPGTPVSAIANDRVADYIVGRYRSCASLRSPNDWNFLFMIRKDLMCP
jgi:Dolichyl-phosphate-mannose-protein mannosyltransferase